MSKFVSCFFMRHCCFAFTPSRPLSTYSACTLQKVIVFISGFLFSLDMKQSVRFSQFRQHSITLSERAALFAVPDKIFLVVSSTEKTTEGADNTDNECATPILAYRRKKSLAIPPVATVVIWKISTYLHV